MNTRSSAKAQFAQSTVPDDSTGKPSPRAYSWRSATTGAMRTALVAGMTHAIKTTVAIAMLAPASVADRSA